MNEYDNNFYLALENGVKNSSQVIVPIILNYTKAKSVLDVGCGNGIWLKEFEINGITDYIGIDGDYVQKSGFKADFEKFKPENLENSFDLKRKFDVVTCFEVAEHIDKSYAESFIATLCAHADCVVFSAAIPQQIGTNHINLQSQSYWAEIFSKNGFTAIDKIRPKIWYNPKIEYWYRQNIIVYKKGTVKTPPNSLNKIHPELEFVINKKNTLLKKLLFKPYYTMIRLLHKKNIL